jgi:hypothetical protein
MVDDGDARSGAKSVSMQGDRIAFDRADRQPDAEWCNERCT